MSSISAGLASPFIADPAEDEGADEAHRQGEEQSVGDRRDLDAELLGDVLDYEGQHEEIERVERPAEIGGDDRPYRRPVRFIRGVPDRRRFGPRSYFHHPTRDVGSPPRRLDSGEAGF
jgi:hypothetical protein